MARRPRFSVCTFQHRADAGDQHCPQDVRWAFGLGLAGNHFSRQHKARAIQRGQFSASNPYKNSHAVQGLPNRSIEPCLRGCNPASQAGPGCETCTPITEPSRPFCAHPCRGFRRRSPQRHRYPQSGWPRSVFGKRGQSGAFAPPASSCLQAALAAWRKPMAKVPKAPFRCTQRPCNAPYWGFSRGWP